MLEKILDQALKKMELNPPVEGYPHIADEDILFYIREKGIPSPKNLENQFGAKRSSLLMSRIKSLEPLFDVSESQL